jgi:LmbE family N-acetylglucosaminyl deacetylase
LEFSEKNLKYVELVSNILYVILTALALLLIFYPQFVGYWAGSLLIVYATFRMVNSRFEKWPCEVTAICLGVIIIFFPWLALLLIAFLLIFCAMVKYTQKNYQLKPYDLASLIIGILIIIYPQNAGYLIGILVIIYSFFQLLELNFKKDPFWITILIIGILIVLFPQSISFLFAMMFLSFVFLHLLKEKWTLIAMVILILLASGAMAETYFDSHYEYENINFAEGPQISSADRILIVAPHPDDESLATAGVISKAVEVNASVCVVLMTNGDRQTNPFLYVKDFFSNSDFTKLGSIRHYESIKAIKKLGLNESHIIFLSYPDQSLKDLFDNNWDYDNPYNGINGETNSPYPFAYKKNVTYCGESVHRNLKQIIDDSKPTKIFYPDPGDNNPDHWASHAFVDYTTSEMGYDVEKYNYLVHKGIYWPSPRNYAPDEYLLPPTSNVGPDAKWIVFPLTGNEIKNKEQAINSYSSQDIFFDPLLKSFIRKNELFAVYPDVQVSAKSSGEVSSKEEMGSSYYTDIPSEFFSWHMGTKNDLVKVGFAWDLADSKAQIVYQNEKKIDASKIYIFHLRIFKNGSVKRVDITVQNGKATSELMASNSIFLNDPIIVQIEGNQMVLTLTSEPFVNIDSFMISVDTIDTAVKTGTGWRNFVLM